MIRFAFPEGQHRITIQPLLSALIHYFLQEKE
jgi:hypothetical protein